MTKPDAKSIAFTNYHGLEPLPRQWPIGQIRAIYVPLELPQDLTTSASYWLGVSLWQHGNNRIIPIVSSRQELLSSQMALVTSISIVSPDTSSVEQPVIDHYNFDNGISLDNYGNLTVLDNTILAGHLRWRTDRVIENELIQLLHLYHRNSDNIIILDMPPCDGHFPTEDWPADLVMITPYNIALPADMASGEWEIVTGLYDAETKDRLSVVDGEGILISDALISLGTIHKQ